MNVSLPRMVSMGVTWSVVGDKNSSRASSRLEGSMSRARTLDHLVFVCSISIVLCHVFVNRCGCNTGVGYSMWVCAVGLCRGCCPRTVGDREAFLIDIDTISKSKSLERFISSSIRNYQSVDDRTIDTLTFNPKKQNPPQTLPL